MQTYFDGRQDTHEFIMLLQAIATTDIRRQNLHNFKQDTRGRIYCIVFQVWKLSQKKKNNQIEEHASLRPAQTVLLIMFERLQAITFTTSTTVTHDDSPMYYRT